MRFWLTEGQRPDRYYLYLDLPRGKYPQFKLGLERSGVPVWDRSGEPYPSFLGQYTLFCYVPRAAGPRAEVEARVREVLQASAQPPSAASPITLAAWEQSLDVTLRRMRRPALPAEKPEADRLLVAEYVRGGQYFEAEQTLDAQRAAGVPLEELVKQYIWVYAEAGKWPEVAETFEAASSHLNGSLRSHRRAGQAYLELARTEEPSDRRSRLLLMARERLAYCLELAESVGEPAEQALLLQLQAAVEEQDREYPAAAILQVRAYVVRERNGLPGLGEMTTQVAATLRRLAGDSLSDLGGELLHWLDQLPDGGHALLAAAGLSRSAWVLPTPAVDDMAATTDPWAVQLADLTEQMASRPAETAARAGALLSAGDLPAGFATALRLLRARARAAVLGYTPEVWGELHELWAGSKNELDLYQRLELLAELVRAAGRRGDAPAVSAYGEQFLQTGQAMVETAAAHQGPVRSLLSGSRTGEVLALMGMAAEQAGELDRALMYMHRALELGWTGKETYAALARIHRERGELAQAQDALLRVLDEDPADTTALERLLDLYMDQHDWESSLQVCERFLEQLPTPEAARPYLRFYEYRKMFLEALLGRGRQDLLFAYAGAVQDLMDLWLESGDAARALDTFREVRERLVGTPYLVDAASSLEPGDAACRQAAATEFVSLVVDEIAQMPRHNPAVLRDLLQRVYVVSEPQYRELVAFYRERQQEIDADPMLRPAGGLSDVTAASVDLSGRRIAVVGAYADVRRRAAAALAQETGLADMVEVPPPWERHLSQDDIKALIRNVDLVVEVPRCVKHQTTVAVDNILRTHPIPRIYCGGKGHSSIVDAVLRHYRAPTAQTGA